MSKSLGNSPDPLTLIDGFGADALRFGVMRAAPLGQDVLFDEKQVELGRNFCTKLWNAARFRQMQGGETEGEIEPALLSSDDKWILLRLDTAIHEVTEALDGYRFNEAVQVLHRFFWSEYCDWYLEAAKASLTGPDPRRQANTLAVTDFVLAHALRLFHPFLPFITEELWHSLGYNTDLPADQGAQTIMFAHWPKPLDDDFKAHYGLTPADEAFAAAKYETVTRGRNLRREFNLPSNKRLRFVLKPSAPVGDNEAAVLKLLLNAEPFEMDLDYAPPKATPTALTPFGELCLPLEGVLDPATERQRLGKEIARIEADLQAVRRKLGNESFVQNAPAAVVAEHRERETDRLEKLAQLRRLLEALG
jgi:valyl-tRNA synthetase